MTVPTLVHLDGISVVHNWQRQEDEVFSPLKGDNILASVFSYYSNCENLLIFIFTLLINKCMQCSIESLASCSSSKQRPLPRFRISPFFHYLELPVVTYCAVNWTFSSNKLSFNYQITAPNPWSCVSFYIFQLNLYYTWAV